MSHQRTPLLILAIAVAACALLPAISPAAAQPSAAQAAAERARLDSALEKLGSARQTAAGLEAQVDETSAELDRIVSEQDEVRARLRTRANAMYRSGTTSFLSVLLGARTFDEFVARWDLLMRLNRQDAEDARLLEEARVATAQKAESLMGLQAEQAKAVDALESELARARRDLAASQAALAEYNARVAADAERARQAAKSRSDAMQQRRGSGEWKTAVASHYGLSFTGRGASGEVIGPYSMIVAHKTLPFGTLIEFEYGGKRAVARVADRGPHSAGREFDLGPGVARVLDFRGVDEVRYRIIGR